MTTDMRTDTCPAFDRGCGRYATLGAGASSVATYATRGLCGGDRLCPTCMDTCEREILADPETVRYTCYVSSDGRSITGWRGNVLGVVTHRGAVHPWSRRGEGRYYLRARSTDGRDWHGTGAPGMFCTLRAVTV